MIFSYTGLYLLLLIFLLKELHVNCFLDNIPHHIVKPVIYHNRIKRDTTSNNDGHIDKLSVILDARGLNFTLNLERNNFLYSSEFAVRTFKDKKVDSVVKLGNESNHCHYYGTVEGESESFVSISTCSGIRGMIVTDDTYYIHPLEDSTSGNHALWSSKDDQYKFKCGTCEAKDVIFSTRLKRDVKSIKWPGKDGEQSRIVELYLVSDRKHYFTHKEKVVERTQETVNHINGLYMQLGVYVVLVGLDIWTDIDMITVTENSTKTLNSFAEYRRKYINPNYANDNAHLITGVDFEKGVIGKAPIKSMCTSSFSCGVNMDHRPTAVSIASTIAHEMGHNFGMEHDRPGCDCPGKIPCIMAATSGREQTKWSSCSKEQLQDSWDSGTAYCLGNLPKGNFKGSVCGNGFTEEGEECDCGSPQFCTSKCCNASTCQFFRNATCATGACCDLDTCEIKEAATICRKASGICDLTEYCDGESEWCPLDDHKYNGMPCETKSDGDSYCYDGQCKTRDKQCAFIWGNEVSSSHPQCYEYFNKKGDAYGSCGFKYFEKKNFTKCNDEDVMCGTLHCNTMKRDPSFWKGMHYLLYTIGRVYPQNQEQVCHGVLFDTGLNDPDPSYVFDGTKCGNDKMCKDNKCSSLSSLGYVKAMDCAGNGVQTTLGTCYCDSGYEPPECKAPGGGGSIHSGPPAPKQGLHPGEIAAIVITLLLLLCIPIVLCVLYKCRPSVFRKVSKGASRPLRIKKPSFNREKSNSTGKQRPDVSIPVVSPGSDNHANNYRPAYISQPLSPPSAQPEYNTNGHLPPAREFVPPKTPNYPSFTSGNTNLAELKVTLRTLQEVGGGLLPDKSVDSNNPGPISPTRPAPRPPQAAPPMSTNENRPYVLPKPKPAAKPNIPNKPTAVPPRDNIPSKPIGAPPSRNIPNKPVLPTRTVPSKPIGVPPVRNVPNDPSSDHIPHKPIGVPTREGYENSGFSTEETDNNSGNPEFIHLRGKARPSLPQKPPR